MVPIDLGDLKAGMIVARPVHNAHGALMLNEGTVLSEKNIWILKSWGVDEVWVLGGHSERKNADNAQRPKTRESVEKEAGGRGAKGLEDQVMVEIMRVAAMLVEQRTYQDKKRQ
jgi:hypothetical protein